MVYKPTDIVQGTLDMLVLKTLALEPMHGYGITVRLEQMSQGTFRVNAGSLFVALQRLQPRVAPVAAGINAQASVAGGSSPLAASTRIWELRRTSPKTTLTAAWTPSSQPARRVGGSCSSAVAIRFRDTMFSRMRSKRTRSFCASASISSRVNATACARSWSTKSMRELRSGGFGAMTHRQLEGLRNRGRDCAVDIRPDQHSLTANFEKSHCPSCFHSQFPMRTKGAQW